MRETRFIEQNKEKWASFEQVLKDNQRDPEKLKELFTVVMDDLSYSRTFYPNRSVRVYLNNVAQRLFYSVYKNKRNFFTAFRDFWAKDLPQLMYEARRELRLALAVFSLFVAVGLFSSYMDSSFPRVILGDAYVDMTHSNIDRSIENPEKYHPLDVYQDDDQLDMALRITYNNILVAVLTFVLGLFLGIGTIGVLLRNGIMVGAFQYLFIDRGIYLDSFLTIWIHGAIEISSIVLAGAAGLLLGKGLVFPGTLTRFQSFQLSARRGVQLMMSLIPLFILAGFIEGFVTWYSVRLPYVLRALFVLASFAFILWYYAWIPWRVGKRQAMLDLQRINLPPAPQRGFEWVKIKNVGELFSDTFVVYRRLWKPILRFALVLGLATVLLLQFVGTDFYVYQSQYVSINIIGMFFEALNTTLNNTAIFLFRGEVDAGFFLTWSGISLTGFIVLHRMRRMAYPQRKFSRRYWLYTLSATPMITGLMLWLSLYAEEATVLLVIALVYPLCFLWLSVVFNESKNIFTAFGRIFQVLGGNIGSFVGIYFFMALISMIFLMLVGAPFTVFYTETIMDNLSFSEEVLGRINEGLNVFIVSTGFFFLFPLLFASMSIAFFSFRETKEATDLFEKIPQLGERKKAYGLETE